MSERGFTSHRQYFSHFRDENKVYTKLGGLVYEQFMYVGVWGKLSELLVLDWHSSQCFIVLVHWSTTPQIDSDTHPDTLS